MRLGYKIAVRFLKSNLGQTILIVLGIAIGVSVQIFIGSLIQGLQKSLLDKTIGNSPQITVTSTTEEKEITGYQSYVKRIDGTDPRIQHISAAADHSAFLEYETTKRSILIRGLDLAKAEDIYHIKENLTEGVMPTGEKEILLGEPLKEEYGVALNDEVTIVTTSQKQEKAKVVGFFDLKVASLNSNWGIMTLPGAQTLFETPDSVTSIEMQVAQDAVFDADVIATQITDALAGEPLAITNWKAQNEQLLSGLSGQSISSLMIQIFVLISVVLGIASVLAITVMQKSRQIGILKAMGLKNRTSSYVFLFEGLILGVLGAIFGILFGLGLGYSFTKFALNPDGTPVIALYISTSFIVISGLIAVAASVLAALIPAIRSSKLNPIDIIRNN